MYQVNCEGKTVSNIGDELLNIPVEKYPVRLDNTTDKKAFAVRDYLMPSRIKFNFRSGSGDWIVSIK